MTSDASAPAPGDASASTAASAAPASAGRADAATPPPSDRFVREIRIGPDFPGFDGHFPGEPVLPGMCHVTLALETVRAAAARPELALRGILRARFSRKVVPGDVLTIEVVRREAADAGGRAGRLRDELVCAALIESAVWTCTHRVGGVVSATLTIEVAGTAR